MNASQKACAQVRRHLLGAERSDVLAQENIAHLAQCAACRAWHNRLQQIEANVALLPLPGSHGKEQFVAGVLRGDLERLPAPIEPPARKLWVGITGLAAAACVLIMCGVWLARGMRAAREPVVQLGPAPPIADKTLAGKLLEADLRLAEADTPRQRIEALARLADNLQGEGRALARVAAAKDLNTLARLYGKVVEEGIVPRARSLPDDERRDAVRPLIAQLKRTTRETEELAKSVRAEAAPSLIMIAAAARTGDRALRDLIKEATP